MTKTYDFNVADTRDFSRNVLPPEAADSPLAPYDVEYRRLLGLYDEAVAELRKIAGRGPEAAEADRRALAQSMAAGKPDPGERGTAELHEQFIAQRRKVTGLADAIDAAYDAMRRAIEEHADGWATALADDAAKTGERIDALLREIDAALARTDGAQNAVKWLERALRLGHRRDLPSQRAGSPSVNLGRTAWPREEVFDAVRACARVSAPSRGPAGYGPGAR
jgi:hypothetical protein